MEDAEGGEALRPETPLDMGKCSDLVDSWLSAALGRKIGISMRSALPIEELSAEAAEAGRRLHLGEDFVKVVKLRCQFVEGAAPAIEPALCALVESKGLRPGVDAARGQSLAAWAAAQSLDRLLLSIAKVDPDQLSRVDRQGLAPVAAGLMAGSEPAIARFLAAADPDLALAWAGEARLSLGARLGAGNGAAMRAQFLEAQAEARTLGISAGGARSGDSRRL